MGLVDELGGLPRALAIAKERAGIPARQDVDVVVYPPRPSFFEALSDPRSDRPSSPAPRCSSSTLPAAERRILRELAAPLQLLRRGDPLALMPYDLPPVADEQLDQRPTYQRRDSSYQGLNDS